jgi:hypothetical protein
MRHALQHEARPVWTTPTILMSLHTSGYTRVVKSERGRPFVSAYSLRLSPIHTKLLVTLRRPSHVQLTLGS